MHFYFNHLIFHYTVHVRCANSITTANIISTQKTKQVAQTFCVCLANRARVVSHSTRPSSTCAYSFIRMHKRGYVWAATGRSRERKPIKISGRSCVEPSCEWEKEGDAERHQETLTYCHCTFYILSFSLFRNMCCPFCNRISIWLRKGYSELSLSISTWSGRHGRMECLNAICYAIVASGDCRRSSCSSN